MSYRNRTYVIFDGDNDMWAYAYMLGWIENDGVAFDFNNAHDIKKITAFATEETVKRTLRERIRNSRQAIVLIGDSTKNLFRFVRWEIETCLEMGIPIVAVNLNGKRKLDDNLCPPILKQTPTVHVAFKAKIIQKALDEFCENFNSYKHKTDWQYDDSSYSALNL